MRVRAILFRAKFRNISTEKFLSNSEAAEWGGVECSPLGTRKRPNSINLESCITFVGNFIRLYALRASFRSFSI